MIADLSTARAGEATRIHDLLPMIFGAVQGQLVSAAAELGLGELLGDGERSLDDLAAATATDRAALGRVLRALVRLGLLQEDSPQQFSCTTLGALLRRDSPYSLHHYALMNNREWLLQVMPRLLHSVRTGTSAFADVHGTNCYAYLGQHAADAAVFNSALTELSRQDATALFEVFDFSTVRTVVDLGGGEGLLLQSLLETNPHLHGILVDLPAVARQAAERLKPQVDAGRCRVVGEDFTERVPGGADLYLLKRIVCTSSEWVTDRLLANVRAVIPADGRVLIADPDPESVYGVLFDVLMLIATGGGLSTEADMRARLARSGFSLTRSHATSATLRVLEAVPV